MMNNRKAEKLLEKLPRVLEDQLEELIFTTEMRQNVESRLHAPGFAETTIKPGISPLFPAAAAFIILCAGTFAGLQWAKQSTLPPPETAATPNFTEIETMDIDLDGEEPLEVVNTWRVRESENVEKLVALIWSRDSRGQLNVISTHAVEGNEFLPMVVLSPSMRKGNLVMISSTDRSNQFFYYVFGFDDGEVTEYSTGNTLPVSRFYKTNKLYHWEGEK